MYGSHSFITHSVKGCPICAIGAAQSEIRHSSGRPRMSTANGSRAAWTQTKYKGTRKWGFHQETSGPNCSFRLWGY